MQRINSSNAISLGGAKLGFQDRNLVAGIAGTTVLAAWLNNVQEEIAGIVEAAGITLDGTNMSQLLAALPKIMGANSPSSLTSSGYKKYRDLNAPGGYFIEQWGTGQINVTGAGTFTASVTFPLAFPTACLQVLSQFDGGGGSSYLNFISGASSKTVSGCTIGITATGNAGNSAFVYFAKGY